jgi:hypothetical protein
MACGPLQVQWETNVTLICVVSFFCIWLLACQNVIWAVRVELDVSNPKIALYLFLLVHLQVHVFK